MLQPFSSARAEFTGEADVLLDANENPFDNGINRYPDPYQSELKDKIAQWKAINKENIFLGNGSDEIIDIVIRTFCRPGLDTIRYLYPSFGMYKVMADINDIASNRVLLNEQFDFDIADAIGEQDDKDKLLFLCSPNNPTGNNLDRDKLISCIEGFKGIVIIDEAYINFSNQESCLHLINEYPNLVVLQTFSKALGAAGLRIGMGFANPKILAYMNKVKPPYNIGSQTQQKALDVLSRIDEIDKENLSIIQERNKLVTRLQELSIVGKVYPSDANFLLVRFDNEQKVKNYLIDQKIIVRDRSKLLHCEGCLRLTIGTPTENTRLIEALKSIVL